MNDITFLLIRVEDDEELAKRIERIVEQSPGATVTERKDIKK